MRGEFPTLVLKMRIATVILLMVFPLIPWPAITISVIVVDSTPVEYRVERRQMLKGHANPPNGAL